MIQRITSKTREYAYAYFLYDFSLREVYQRLCNQSTLARQIPPGSSIVGVTLAVTLVACVTSQLYVNLSTPGAIQHQHRHLSGEQGYLST